MARKSRYTDPVQADVPEQPLDGKLPDSFSVPGKPHSTAAFRWKTAMISSAIPLEIRERSLRIMRWAVMTL